MILQSPILVSVLMSSAPVNVLIFMTLDRRKPGQAQPYCPRIASALAADGWRRNPDGAMAQLAADGLRPALTILPFFCLSGFRQFTPAYRQLYCIYARRTARLR